MHWNGWNNMGWAMGWGWLFMILVLVGIVLLVVALIRGGSSGGRQGPRTGGGQRSRARELLDERYARGEIDGAEYDERRRRLEGGSGV